MPGMSGCELADELKTRYARLPVVFISGYGATNLQDNGIDTGNDVLLEKPFGPDALLRTVRATLDASRDQPAVARTAAR